MHHSTGGNGETERATAERQPLGADEFRKLRDTEAQYRFFVERVEEYAIFMISPDGIIASWNKGAELLKGYTQDEAVGMPFARLFTPEDQAANRPRQEMDAAARDGEFKGEGVRMRKDGSRFEARVVLTAVRDDNGELRGFMKVTHDGTRRKRYEEELKHAKEEAERARDEAQQANRSKDRFLAVLSHELRTPLTPVLAAVSHMESMPDLPAGVRPDVELIRRNVEMEARIIDDLLHLTRISKGKVDLHYEVTDAHTLLRHCLEMYQGQIEARHVEVSMGLWARNHFIWADPTRMQQVFCNLLNNAVKFTPEGGRIALRTQEDSEGILTVQVSDSGIGIEPHVLPKVFDAFEQGERRVTRQFGGLGLGLSIAKALVELHGGQIEAASEGRGKGASLTVRLGTIPSPPPEVRSAAGTPVEETAGGPSSRLSILLVEDHEDTLRVLHRLLTALGYRTRTARSVREALDTLAVEQIDLLVSDIGLPDGSGMDIMRAARQARDLPGIAVSGFGMDEDIRQSRAAGFAEHLIKPVSLRQLEEAIRRVASAPT